MNKVKIGKNSFTVKRNAGYYYSDRSAQVLVDDEAMISFSERNNKLRCKFGYKTAGDREYARTMDLARNEIIELRNYLDKILDESKKNELEKEVYFILYNPLFDKKELVEKFEMEKVSNLKLNGYTLHFYRTDNYSYLTKYTKKYYEHELKSERKQRNIVLSKLKTNNRHIYAEVYKTTEKYLIALHNYFDTNLEFYLHSMKLSIDDEEFIAYYHTVETWNLVKIKLNDEDKEKIIMDAETSDYPKEYIDSLKKRYKK